ncbi:DUF3515 family protein [Pseudactinotalea sp. Z1739]|uniref:DUF3515 family protein n=1 Tax=Pseudactinotalea sp. Z1739 TaxID=3413028 RepID=UPI003C7A3267
MGVLRRVLGVAGGLAAGAVVLAGCTPAATVAPGPHASDPMCAEVLRATPQELGGLERRSTTSQSTRAWGDPPITLRCGVEVLGPTTEHCVTITSPDGPAVDWVMREPEDGQADVLTLTTFGRSPAVEVQVPQQWEGQGHDAILSDLAPAITLVPQTRECLSLEEDLL